MPKQNTEYVDGFVIPVPKKNVAAYRKMAEVGRKVWLRHGALDYRECVGDDLAVPCGPGFPHGIKAKPAETVIFAFITYKSRAHRNKVNAKVMKDPELSAGCDPTKIPFDATRMLYGGFKTLVGR
jgi:uncharacterized protein YbaA (DUF1428 family)